MGYRAYAVMLAFLVTGFFQAGFGSREAAALNVAQFGESGFLNIDYQVQARAAWRDQGPDPAKDEDTTDLYLRRNRLSFIGAANEMFGFVLQFEYNGGQKIGDVAVLERQREYDLIALDAYLTADVTDYLRFRAGKTKHILTREVQEGCFDPLSIDRSLFITGPFSQDVPEKTTRDVGLMVWGNLFDAKVQYRLAVMEGNNFGSGMPDGIGYRYSGRVHVSLLDDKEAGVVYRGTYLGKKKVLTLGAGYEMQPDAVYSSGTTGAEDYTAYTYDLFYEHPTEYGTFTLSGAYLKADFNEAGMRGVADAQGVAGEKNGSYWKAGYLIGKIQFFGRYEDWAFAELKGIPDQNIIWTAAGVNYYVKGQDLRLTLEYSKNDFKKEDDFNKDFRTILLQVQAKF